MATTWVPMTRMEPTEWLLANGEVITEPALEMTSSGRKIRVAGTTKSVFASDLDNLLHRAANHVASERGTKVWMQMPEAGFLTTILDHTGHSHRPRRARLHVVHDPSDRQAATLCWWRFKDPSGPYEVLLLAYMHRQGYGEDPRQSVNISIAIPLRHGASGIRVVNVTGEHFADLSSFIPGDHYYEWDEFLRDNPVSWPDEHLGGRTFAFARPAIQHMLKVIHDFEELAEIEVPDTSDPATPDYRTLELYDTNVNAELINDMREYLDGAPTVEKVAEVYQQMLEMMRSIGIAVGKKDENDFLAALLGKETETLSIPVLKLPEEGGSIDHNHRLTIHLPTGSFIVECDHAGLDRNRVAEKWEEAKVMASLTGQEDELLAYAKAYAGKQIQKRTTTILKERIELH